jgi:hypothetical protein
LFGVKRHKIEVILQYGSGHLKLWMWSQFVQMFADQKGDWSCATWCLAFPTY